VDRAAVEAAAVEHELWAHQTATRMRQLAQQVRDDRVQRDDVAEIARAVASLAVRHAHVMTVIAYVGEPPRVVGRWERVRAWVRRVLAV
jgi:hypothetical protein